MNYEKYLIAAGVDDPELRQQCLDYMAKCERDYRAARIVRRCAANVVLAFKEVLQ